MVLTTSDGITIRINRQLSGYRRWRESTRRGDSSERADFPEPGYRTLACRPRLRADADARYLRSVPLTTISTLRPDDDGRRALRSPNSRAATTSESVRFPGSPRFCVRARQARARPGEIFRSARPTRSASRNAPRAVFPLAAPGSYFVKPWPGFPDCSVCDKFCNSDRIQKHTI
jgi:hypothetical protein